MTLQSLGSFVRQKRRESGESQECFARRIGIDRSYLSRIETGHGHDVSHHVARRIAAELGMTIDELDAVLYPEEQRAPERELVPA